MKKLLFVFLLGVFSFSAYSQISVWKPNEKEAGKKPPIYDSLYVNFSYFPIEDAYKYLQYVGQRIIFKPLSKKNKENFNFDEFVVAKDTILRGQVLRPFSELDIAQVLKIQPRGRSKAAQEQALKKLQALENAYLKKFNFQTNIYKPVFTTYKQEDKTLGEINARIGSDLTALENKSFLILNVYQETNMKDTISLSRKQKADNEKLLFMLADEKGDTLFWKTYIHQITRQNLFIIQGFYDKQVNFYKNRELVYRHKLPNDYVIWGDRREKNDYEKIIASYPATLTNTFVDINTEQTVTMNDLKLWKCQDVALIENGYGNDLFYILTSDAGNTIKIPVGELSKKGFVCKESYEMEEKVRILKTEELEELRKQEELRQQEFEKNRMKYLTNRYGQRSASLIAEGKVTLGMTKEMCIEAWGETSSIIQSYNRETWIYSYGSSLSFVGNKLVQIINL